MPYTLRLHQFIFYSLNILITIIEGFLGFRTLLKLLAANPSPFVNWIYRVSQGLLNPFEGMFNSFVTEGGHTLEFSTLFAMAFYALMYYFAYQLLIFISDVIKKNSDHPMHTAKKKEINKTDQQTQGQIEQSPVLPEK